MGLGGTHLKMAMLNIILIIIMGVFWGWCICTTSSDQQVVEAGGGKLCYGFYENTCPQVETIVRSAIQSITLSDPTSPPALLRLMFHDCQVQGCDASILIDASSDDDNNMTMPSEMDSSRNFGIRKRDSIGVIKAMVEAVCPQQVSCADILILAAREAVAMSGGPLIRVPLGRRDSNSTPTYKLADQSLPPANIGVDATLSIFAHTGMTLEEAVAIMGAHTLGVSHCLNLVNRLYTQQEGDSSGDAGGEIDPSFRAMLRLSCPPIPFTPKSSFVLNDLTTLTFDNLYYVNSMGGRGILDIDAELALDPRTAPFVQRFADDEDAFFKVFSSAFVKLSATGVLTGDQGVIRQKCNALS